MREVYFTAQALAGAAGMPALPNKVREKILHAPLQKRSGKGHLYPMHALPLETAADLVARRIPGWVETASGSGRGRPETEAETAARCRSGGDCHGALSLAIPKRGGARLAATSGGAASSPAQDAAVRQDIAVRQDKLSSARAQARAAAARGWQRDCATARAYLLQRLHQMMAGGLPLAAAARRLASEAADGRLDAVAQKYAGMAVAQKPGEAGLPRGYAPENDEKKGAAPRHDGGKRTPSAASLMRWHRAHAQGGIAAITPTARQPEARLPEWTAAALIEWGKPSKPSLPAVHEALQRAAAAGEIAACPSRAQLRYFLTQKCGSVAREVGRKTGNAMLALLPHFVRDASDLYPGALWAADGHCFDAEMAHPETGGPVKPEITLIMDVGTRWIYAPGFALAESAIAILDAFVAACGEFGGHPEIFFTDNGAYRAEVLSDADGSAGMMARFGIHHYTSIPCRPQGHGVIEAAHKVLIRAAKRLPTYIGKDADPDAAHAVHRLTRKQVAAMKRGLDCYGAAPRRMTVSGKADGRTRAGLYRAQLPQLDEVKAVIAEEIALHNARPHPALPKFRDAEGRRRHMSPAEAFALWSEKGYPKATMTARDLADMARPRAIRTVQRGQVSVLGQSYFAGAALEEFHGQKVQVAYATGDARQVWVYTLEGGFICTAAFEANKQKFLPESLLEQAKAKRLAAQAKRLAAHAAENEAQRWAQTVSALPEPAADENVIEALWARQEAEAASRAALEEDFTEVLARLEARFG